MPYLHTKYYYSKDDMPQSLRNLTDGYEILQAHPLFGQLRGEIYAKASHLSRKGAKACVTRSGNVFANPAVLLDADEWAYVLAHCLLHHAFRHFDRDSIPQSAEYQPALWNKACDIYITRFLADVGFGTPIFADPADEYPIRLNSEERIYEYLLGTKYALPQQVRGDDMNQAHGANPGSSVHKHIQQAHPCNAEQTITVKSDSSVHLRQTYGCNADQPDMIGVEHPIIYKANERNLYAEQFAHAILRSVKTTIGDVGSRSWDESQDTPVRRAADWFLSSYPLLGGLAASFQLIENVETCHRFQIHIAAVDAARGEIYANPSCGLNEQEWRFVLAHEYLHAGLQHRRRCQGRNPYLWNIACDYVVNDWLVEMQVGEIPREGFLYDKALHGLSAESVYDRIVKAMRKFGKMATFRGYSLGDVFGGSGPRFEGMNRGISLDNFFQNALREGLDYHVTQDRGYLPTALIEEIRALSMPPIPWEVQLAEWFDEQFPPLEKHRSYARPSRRQGATPDIPRPRYIVQEAALKSRTFGVVLDTSGSMSSREIGLALGAIASYAVSKDVSAVRVVFCDAQAYDAGYLSPEEIAGRVEVKGRGGTILQPAVTLLEEARDFPKDGPILLITDGKIEERLYVHREHAYLLPRGNRLPFQPRGKVFSF